MENYRNSSPAGPVLSSSSFFALARPAQCHRAGLYYNEYLSHLIKEYADMIPKGEGPAQAKGLK